MPSIYKSLNDAIIGIWRWFCGAIGRKDSHRSDFVLHAPSQRLGDAYDLTSTEGIIGLHRDSIHPLVCLPQIPIF